MSDRTLTCRDCGQAFTFTAGEQAFYAERGFSEPQRCPSCRSARKAQRASQGYDSGYGGSGGGSGGYSSGGYSGGGSYSAGGGGYSSGGGGYSSGGGGGYSSGPRQMYPAVCSECGRDTEVPFEPRSDKPVYCRECFQLRRTAAPPRNYNYEDTKQSGKGRPLGRPFFNLLSCITSGSTVTRFRATEPRCRSRSRVPPGEPRRPKPFIFG
jgi:CxxC-x17-CxxC domain-containing protein